jgi:hypothetical protein
VGALTYNQYRSDDLADEGSIENIANLYHSGDCLTDDHDTLTKDDQSEKRHALLIVGAFEGDNAPVRRDRDGG